MLKRILAALTVSVAALTADQAAAAFVKKVALVVGNGAYQHAPSLTNPVADAKAVAAAFDRLGFETVTGYDLSRMGMTATMRTFARASRNADLTVFYYAGHGIAYDGRNFMVPVDAKFDDPTALDFEAVGVDFVTKQMRYADGVSLVFLDACRDNPLAATLSRSMGFSTRSAVSRGLAQMDVTGAGKGLAIAFATSPGQVAYDGAGSHSPFTSALLKHIETPDTDSTEVMSRVTGEVLRSTDEKQRPWLNASLTGPVVLKPVPAAGTPVEVAALTPNTMNDASPAATQRLEAQTLLFNLARETGKAADYEAYLATFPTGLYAHNARAAIEAMADKRAVRINRPLAVAAVDTAAAEPLSFSESDKVKAAGTQESEAALKLTRAMRREVQHRLNLAEANVGGADGLFGPMTRRGISTWQEANAFPATGFLTGAQVAALKGATESEYQALVARQRAAAEARAEQAKRVAAARAKSRSVAKKSTARRKTTTARKTTARKTAKRRTRAASKTRVVRQERVVVSRRRVSSRSRSGGVNPVAAAAAGALVGGIVGAYIGR